VLSVRFTTKSVVWILPHQDLRFDHPLSLRSMFHISPTISEEQTMVMSPRLTTLPILTAPSSSSVLLSYNNPFLSNCQLIFLGIGEFVEFPIQRNFRVQNKDFIVIWIINSTPAVGQEQSAPTPSTGFTD